MAANADSRPRHIHLGDRLEALESIKRGVRSPLQIAAELGVEVADIVRWMEIHANDRIVRIDDLMAPDRTRELVARAQRLLDLIYAAEASIRSLVHELARRSRANRTLGKA